MKKKLLLLLFCLSYSLLFWGQNEVKENNVNRENVISQMNYCMMSLTNIIHNKSMEVLQHESDQIINNLTMQHIVGLRDIKDFRSELMDAISQFEITEEERMLMKRLQSIQRDNLKWQALSNALNPTMLLTGGVGPGMAVQAAFQTLLTVARSVVEYKTAQGEQNIEELQAMWNLRKSDMEEINKVRKSAQEIIFNIYEKYHLNESSRLTENTAILFSKYTSEPDAQKRIRLLLDNKEKYADIADFYYYLGMAYVDLDQYEKAKSYFQRYTQLYEKAPIFRYNEKSGCIDLAMLVHDKHLTDTEKKAHIQSILKNLPSNSAALLQCAMIYLRDLHQPETAYDLLRSGIDDPLASDQDLLVMVAANMLPDIKKYPTVYANLKSAVEKCPHINAEVYITYVVNKEKNAWPSLQKLISFDKVNDSDWYDVVDSNPYLKTKFYLYLPEDRYYKEGDFKIYRESHRERLDIYQMTDSYSSGVSLADLEDVDCFKANKDLKYLYFDVLVPNEYFMVKKNFDEQKVLNSEWPRQGEFVLTNDDLEDIVDFCKDHANNNNFISVKCKSSEADPVYKQDVNDMPVYFSGEKLSYVPYHSYMQQGDYVRIYLQNGICIMYKYNGQQQALQPYLYTDGKRTVYAGKSIQKEYNFGQKAKVALIQKLGKYETMHVDEYLLSLMQKNNAWNELENFINFDNISSGGILGFGDKTINDELTINLNGSYGYGDGLFRVYKEIYTDGHIRIKQLRPTLKNGIVLDDLDDLECVKRVSRLKTYFEALERTRWSFQLIKCISRGEFSELESLNLSTDDIKELVSYFKQKFEGISTLNYECSAMTEIFKPVGGMKKIPCDFCGDKLTYHPNESSQRKGEFLRIQLKGGACIVFRFNANENRLERYLYSDGKRTVFVNTTIQREYRDLPTQKVKPKVEKKEKKSEKDEESSFWNIF